MTKSGRFNSNRYWASKATWESSAEWSPLMRMTSQSSLTLRPSTMRIRQSTILWNCIAQNSARIIFSTSTMCSYRMRFKRMSSTRSSHSSRQHSTEWTYVSLLTGRLGQERLLPWRAQVLKMTAWMGALLISTWNQSRGLESFRELLAFFRKKWQNTKNMVRHSRSKYPLSRSTARIYETF